MALPSLGALSLVFFAIGIPAYELFAMGRTNALETTADFLSHLFMFGLGGGFWIGLGLGSFGVGFLLAFKTMRSPEKGGTRILGFLLAFVPLFIIGLAPIFMEFHGP